MCLALILNENIYIWAILARGALTIKVNAENIPGKPDTDNTGVGMLDSSCFSAMLLTCKSYPCTIFSAGARLFLI
jgi:hypothetical protein